MNELCVVNEKHPNFERFCYLVLTILFVSSAVKNIMMAVQIIPCMDTPDFMMLTENIWVLSSWMGKLIFTFMEYYYVVKNPIILVMSCFSVLDVMMIFGTILMFLQMTKRKAANYRKQMLFITSGLRIVALLLMLMFIVFTLNSLTTAQAFTNLRIGSAIYGIGNLLSILPLFLGLLKINK